MVTDTWNPELQQWLRERSSAIGFELAGVAAVDAPSSLSESLDASRFEAWIEAGSAGEMEYLKRRDAGGRFLRSSVQIAHPWANSVIVCAMNYNTPGLLSTEPAPANSGWIARYAWSGEVPSETGDTAAPAGTDYHDFLLTPLHRLACELEERAGGESKCYVDTGPLVERSLAARAGVGWIGKNTCVLHQGQGSWLLLGVILSSLRLPPRLATLPAADRCGSCTRCIDACPTEALTSPHQMDASRCIAYLTIEKKGAIPVALREPMGRQVFGCDICQDVCPWNRHTRAEIGSFPPASIRARQELINPDLGWLASMDAATFKRWFKGSPLERTRRSRLHRNVAIAMGNSAEKRFMPQLRTWRDGDDPVLAEASSWALAKIERAQDLGQVEAGEERPDTGNAPPALGGTDREEPLAKTNPNPLSGPLLASSPRRGQRCS